MPDTQKEDNNLRALNHAVKYNIERQCQVSQLYAIIIIIIIKRKLL